MAEAQDDARRAAVVSSFFYFLGDVLVGSNGTSVPDRGWMRNDGLMGPPTEAAGLYLGADGRWYPRGVSAMPAAQAQPAAQVAGITITPGLLMLAGLAFLLLKK